MQTSLLSKYGLVTVLIFVAVEGLISFVKKDEVFDRKDTVANIAIGVVSNLFGLFLWSALGYAAYAWANTKSLFTISMAEPWMWAAVILAADVAWYVEHRVGHRARLFWAVHSVHHSSEKFNFSVALRLPWLGGLMRIPFLLPVAFLGFPPIAVLSGFSVVFLYQIWVHTEYVGKLGFLEEFLNTPSHHRVHHASNAEYLDKNYGGILIVWDRIFGTFKREDGPARYGILHPLGTHNLFVIQFRDLFASAKTLLRASSPREAGRILFGDPAYVPVHQIGDASPALPPPDQRQTAV